MGQRVRVLIADDHLKSRKGLRALLATCPTVEAIFEAENGREAARLVEDCQPDMVLMDIQMPVWNGLEATRYIKARWPQVRIVALTIHASWQGAALAAGADSFLVKGCPSQELLAAVECGLNVQTDFETSASQERSVPLAFGTDQARPMRIAPGKATASM